MESQTSAASIAATPPGVVLDGVEVLPSRPRRVAPPLAAVPPPAPQPAVVPPPPVAPPVAPPAPVVAPIQQTVAPEPPRILRRHAEILDMFTVFARILSARFLLFLALIGAFVLALQAMQQQTIPAIAVLISYCLLTVGVLVGLELFGKRG